MAFVRSGSGGRVASWRVCLDRSRRSLAFRPSGAPGNWNCRRLLDRCVGAPLDVWMAPAHRCAGPQCVLLPHRGIELTLWIALSVSAGIGYVQRQFMGMTKSAAADILLAAATFGAA